jgi:glyoxylase-like metal-dependent hydrolase (beta-lactamase superfamily II)
VVKAGIRGPFTLDGTRTFLIGKKTVAVIDPGPEVETHLRALVSFLETAEEVRILLTHGHSDHAGGASSLAEKLGVRVFASPSYRQASPDPAVVEVLEEGDRIGTDQGELAVVEVPGHTQEHLAFHWVDAGALFVGDLMLGRGNTTWIGEYRGCVADYLESLEKVRVLSPLAIYPAHGPPLTNPTSALDRFRNHREDRIREVAEARRLNPGAPPEDLARAIYGGELPDRLVKAARRSVEVMLFHLDSPSNGATSRGS